MIFARRYLPIAVCLAGVICASAQEPPPLPTGLGSSEPPLPIGLGEKQGLTESLASSKWSKHFHGFWETRLGTRVSRDPTQPRDLTLGETRLQLRLDKSWPKLTVESRGDLYLDGVSESVEFDLRRLRLLWRPIKSLDISIGRQVMAWGTADMLFINDLFPKDWPSLLLGRDEEYLKAPADAIRLGWYNGFLNLDLAYIPRFEPDRLVTGERVSFWDPLANDFAGRGQKLGSDVPNNWFSDDELAFRLHRNFASYELAFYGYFGRWKSLGGAALFPRQMTFPQLNVYGASLRGPVGRGIGTIEFGYYDSRDDSSGSNPLINNSEFRLLVGYEQEMGKDFTAGFQYYLEHMLDYRNYQRMNFFGPDRDETRHVITARLTKYWRQQTLITSLFAYYSPSDGDAYLRPKVSYQINDQWSVEAGANLFLGQQDHTFFGQLEGNSNIYASLRRSF